MLISKLADLEDVLFGAIGGLVSINLIRKIVALDFNRVRMSLVFLMLAGVSALTGEWREFTGTTIQTLMISGLIGIFLGILYFLVLCSVWGQADQRSFFT